MDPKLNNGETRSFCMRYERGGAPRVRAHVQNTRLPGENEGKRASPRLLARRIARVIAFIILPTISHLSSYLKYRQKYILLHISRDDA